MPTAKTPVALARPRRRFGRRYIDPPTLTAVLYCPVAELVHALQPLFGSRPAPGTPELVYSPVGAMLPSIRAPLAGTTAVELVRVYSAA